MPAYVIADINVTEADAYEDYKKASSISLAAYGGRFVVRGGEASVLEGDWRPNRLVVLEFESVEKARAWWASAEYEAPKALRQRIAITNMIVVEGA